MNDNRTRQLLDRIRKQGVPLSEYVEGKIYRGVLTGLNEEEIEMVEGEG